MLRDQAILCAALLVPTTLLVSVVWSLVTEHASRVFMPAAANNYRTERRGDRTLVNEAAEQVGVPA